MKTRIGYLSLGLIAIAIISCQKQDDLVSNPKTDASLVQKSLEYPVSVELDLRTCSEEEFSDLASENEGSVLVVQFTETAYEANLFEAEDPSIPSYDPSSDMFFCSPIDLACLNDMQQWALDNPCGDLIVDLENGLAFGSDIPCGPGY